MTDTWRTKFEKAEALALDARVEMSKARQSGLELDRQNAHEAAQACACAIAEFDTFWRHSASRDDLFDIRKRCHGFLPKILLENGTETRTELLRQPLSKDPDGKAFEIAWKNADDFQRYLAGIQLELDDLIEGAPPTATDRWASIMADLRPKLLTLAKAPEPTKGAKSMSQRANAHRAFQLFNQAERFSKMRSRASLDDEEADPPEHEQRWFREGDAELSLMLFEAVSCLHIALGKEMQPHALRGKKVISGAEESAKQRSSQTRPISDRTLQFMDTEIQMQKIKNVSAAAETAFANGHGRSPEANRKLYQRYRQK